MQEKGKKRSNRIFGKYQESKFVLFFKEYLSYLLSIFYILAYLINYLTSASITCKYFFYSKKKNKK